MKCFLLMLFSIVIIISCQRTETPPYKAFAEATSDDRMGMEILVKKPLSLAEIEQINKEYRKNVNANVYSRIDIYLPEMRPDEDSWAFVETIDGKARVVYNKKK